MGNYHSEQPFKSEFEPRSGDLDPTKTEAINPHILMDSVKEEIEQSEVMEVSIVEDNETPLNQDWFHLARKLRGQNRELLDTVVKLEQP